MDLKVGDLVAFKNYEDMTDEEQSGIIEENFPKFGKVSEVIDDINRFKIEGKSYTFSTGSIDYVISNSDTGDIHIGDEVLMKVTIIEIKGNDVWVSWVDKKNIVKILKRKEPEHFIVQEDYYGMYIGFARELVSDKSKAKLYTSLDAANSDAVDMRLNDWDVIPYDD